MMKCLLDLDGVLVDFVGGICRAHGCPNPYDDPANHGDYDMYPLMGVAIEEFWRPAGESFWAELEWMPDGRDILSAVEASFGRENVCLLSSPCKTPGCEAGKVRWIREHLPDYGRRFLIGAAKEFCAHPGAVLIDDSDPNVEKFLAHGGNAVLVPRPWNSWHSESGRSIDAELLRRFWL